MKNRDQYFKELKENIVMKTSELKAYIPSRTQIGRLVKAGELISLGSGLYSHPSTDPFTASLIAVARYYPQATISNITALVVHDLSDERIDRIDVDIPRNTSIRNKLICAHRVAPKNIIGGILLRYHSDGILAKEMGRTDRIYSCSWRPPVECRR